MGSEPNPECRLCGRNDETSLHLMCGSIQGSDITRLWDTRSRTKRHSGNVHQNDSYIFLENKTDEK